MLHLSISIFLKSLMPLVHVPVMLGMLFGMEHLCALPVEQFHRSGVSFLPDFTVPDPTSYAVLHVTQGTFFSRLLPAWTSLPWFHTSIVGALFSRLLPARLLHQAALNLGPAHTTMTDDSPHART